MSRGWIPPKDLAGDNYSTQTEVSAQTVHSVRWGGGSAGSGSAGWCCQGWVGGGRGAAGARRGGWGAGARGGSWGAALSALVLSQMRCLVCSDSRCSEIVTQNNTLSDWRPEKPPTVDEDYLRQSGHEERSSTYSCTPPNAPPPPPSAPTTRTHSSAKPRHHSQHGQHRRQKLGIDLDQGCWESACSHCCYCRRDETRHRRSCQAQRPPAGDEGTSAAWLRG